MISQHHRKIRNTVLIIIIISTTIILGITIWLSCPIIHLGILNDIEMFNESLDPEFCESIVYRIDAFNEKCEPEIEIIDCG